MIEILIALISIAAIVGFFMLVGTVINMRNIQRMSFYYQLRKDYFNEPPPDMKMIRYLRATGIITKKMHDALKDMEMMLE